MKTIQQFIAESYRSENGPCNDDTFIEWRENLAVQLVEEFGIDDEQADEEIEKFCDNPTF